jgi:Ca2+-binding EF-hand superfamily protein
VRAWLRNHGKSVYIGFDDVDRRELRKFFNSLDDSRRGSIGYKELEEPLLALGLAETRQQVKEMVDVVDRDGSGQIEFEEFLSILCPSSSLSVPTAAG